MPKYYCDYCDVFLTHDSPSVRKTHNSGWKHKNAVKAWYSQYEIDHTQLMIDQKVREFEEKMGVGSFTSKPHAAALIPVNIALPINTLNAPNGPPNITTFGARIPTGMPNPNNPNLSFTSNFIPKPSAEQPQDPGSKRAREENINNDNFGDKRMRLGN